MTLARALMHRSEEGKHYGVLTAKFVAVLRALLWGFHNAATGKCFPSYERIAEKADCAGARSMRQSARWRTPASLRGCNRIRACAKWGPDLFGRAQNRWRVVRTTNQYRFVDPQPPARPPDSSKFEFQTGTEGQEFFSCRRPRSIPKIRCIGRSHGSGRVSEARKVRR